jgi:hypothetical protein
MPYSDKKKQAAYQRAYHRRVRSGLPTTGVLAIGEPSGDGDEWRAESLKDLLRIETETLNDLRAATEMDVAVRSRAIAQNVGVALRIVELLDVEAGIDKVDAALKARKGKSKTHGGGAEWQVVDVEQPSPSAPKDDADSN